MENSGISKETVKAVAIAISTAPLSKDFYVTHSGNIRPTEVRSDMNMAQAAIQALLASGEVFLKPDVDNDGVDRVSDAIFKTDGHCSREQAQKLAKAAITAIQQPVMDTLVEEKWYGYAGHFIGGKSCAYHLCTRIPGFLVSTVGHYIPRSHKDESPYPIGAGEDSLYETYIFECSGEDKNGDPIIPSFSEIDGERYAKSIDAENGHYRYLEKYKILAAQKKGAK